MLLHSTANFGECSLSTLSPEHFFNFYLFFFSSALCCCMVSVARHSVFRPSVKPVYQKPLNELPPNFGENYLSNTSPDRFYLFLFSFFKFYFNLIFFTTFFVNMGPYGNKISDETSPESTHQIRSFKKSCILPMRVSTKVVQTIVKFQCLDFCLF